jgi:hypothetical protein
MNLSEKFLLAADKKLSNKGKNKNLLDTTSRLIEAGLETGGTIKSSQNYAFAVLDFDSYGPGFPDVGAVVADGAI